jgi:hypothetical protein
LEERDKMSYINDYIKNRYHTDEEFRKRQIDSIKKYQKTKKGIATRKRAADNLKIRNPSYYADFMKARRKEAKKNNICTHCFKNKARKGKHECRQCSEHRKILHEAKNVRS